MNIEELTKKIILVMSKHIGEENAILSTEFFEQVYETNPEDVDVYERRYLWEAILRINSKLRSTNVMFIITKYNLSFVLKSMDERDDYHKVQNARKKSIDRLKRNATQWVAEEKWKKIKQQKKILIPVIKKTKRKVNKE